MPRELLNEIAGAAGKLRTAAGRCGRGWAARRRRRPVPAAARRPLRRQPAGRRARGRRGRAAPVDGHRRVDAARAAPPAGGVPAAGVAALHPGRTVQIVQMPVHRAAVEGVPGGRLAAIW